MDFHTPPTAPAAEAREQAVRALRTRMEGERLLRRVHAVAQLIRARVRSVLRARQLPAP